MFEKASESLRDDIFKLVGTSPKNIGFPKKSHISIFPVVVFLAGRYLKPRIMDDLW